MILGRTGGMVTSTCLGFSPANSTRGSGLTEFALLAPCLWSDGTQRHVLKTSCASACHILLRLYPGWHPGKNLAVDGPYSHC